MTINVGSPVPLDWSFIDLALRERDAQQPGFYIACTRMTDQQDFRGGALYSSYDDSNWTLLTTLPTEQVVSIAETVLATDASGASLWDTTSTITVRPFVGELESKTADEVIAGANTMLMGSELVGFQTATLQAGGEYILSNLLRKRRGTPDNLHVLNERCILIDSGIQFVRRSLRDIGKQFYFKVVPAGGAIVDYPSYAITFNGDGFWAHSRLANTLKLKSRTDTTPPSSPAEGDLYYVAATATGDWVGQEGNLTQWHDGWIFFPTPEGFIAWVEDADEVVRYNGSAWATFGGGGGGGSSFLEHLYYFEDETYEYFVGMIPNSANWQVNRYDLSNVLTTSTGGGAPPNTLVACQALTYS